MHAQLHRSYSLREALRQFPAGRRLLPLAGRFRSEWDGQLHVSTEHAVLFCTLGSPESRPHLVEPTQLLFRPDRKCQVENGGSGWIPPALTDREREDPFTHLFARAEGDEEYIYLGRGHLWMYNGAEDYRQQEAHFELSEKPPREIWLRLGGYAGWKVEVDHQALYLASDDVEGLQACLNRLRAVPDSHLTMRRYEGDELTVYTNETLGYVSLSTPTLEVSSREAVYAGDPEAVADFTCGCGIGLEYPRGWAIPKEDALGAAAHFFRTAEPADWITWSDD